MQEIAANNREAPCAPLIKALMMSINRLNICAARRVASAMLLWGLALVLAGCGTRLANRLANELDIEHDAQSLADSGPQLYVPLKREYQVRPGDKLDVKFFFAPELNDTQSVRTDGRMSLQLVGEIAAAGKTPSELSAIVTNAYAEVLRDPKSTVMVRESSARIFVGGEIARPNFVRYDSEITALQAIFSAGGFTQYAQPTSVIVLRKVEGDERIAVRIDLSHGIIEGKEDLQLAADDVVFVPKSAIGKWDKMVEQYVQQAIPLQMSYRREPFQTTVGSFR
jgi:polysaccharide export outer membrane protein